METVVDADARSQTGQEPDAAAAWVEHRVVAAEEDGLKADIGVVLEDGFHVLDCLDVKGLRGHAELCRRVERT
jgi:hypothetical protein